MASARIVSHPFVKSFFETLTWPGGQRCETCTMPRYDHEARETEDYRYSSWSVSRELNQQITDALRGMRSYRHDVELYRNGGDSMMAGHFERMADQQRAILAILFEIHHAGLDTVGSWAPARERSFDRRLRAYDQHKFGAQ